jgi:hypothetical protein
MSAVAKVEKRSDKLVDACQELVDEMVTLRNENNRLKVEIKRLEKAVPKPPVRIDVTEDGEKTRKRHPLAWILDEDPPCDCRYIAPELRDVQKCGKEDCYKGARLSHKKGKRHHHSHHRKAKFSAPPPPSPQETHEDSD